MQHAINVRDYLIVSLVFINMLRASNIMSITLKEMYKCTIIYGAKIVLVPESIFKHIQIFIQHMKPISCNTNIEPQEIARYLCHLDTLQQKRSLNK